MKKKIVNRQPYKRKNSAVSNIIKTNKRFNFVDNPDIFVKKNIMVSATRLASDHRTFLLGLRHKARHSKESLAIMDAGTKEHEKIQKGIKTINEYGYMEYRKALCTDHKRIKLQEVEITSPNPAIYGKIDILILEFTKDGHLKVWIEEIKSHINWNYIRQVLGYVIALQDFNSVLIYGRPYKRNPKKAEKKLKREIGFLYPSPKEIKTISIWYRINTYGDNSKSQHFELVVDNGKVVPEKEPFMIATKNLLEEYQEYMRRGVVNLCDFPHDKYCCKNFGHICSKINYNPKDKQYYLGRNKILVKNPYKRI